MRSRLAIAGAAALFAQSVSAPALASDVGDVARTAPQSGGVEQTNGKRELVFVDVELGPAYVDMLALKDGDLLDARQVKASGFGLTYGAAFGVRLHEFTLAARYRHGDFSDWQLWTLGGEASMNFTLGRIAPQFGLGAGYASLDGTDVDFNRALVPFKPPPIYISGLNVRVHAAVDYYVFSWFTAGAKLSGDAFFLRRKGDHLPRLSSSDPNSPPIFPFASDGSGNGVGATLTLVLGLHY